MSAKTDKSVLYGAGAVAAFFAWKKGWLKVPGVASPTVTDAPNTLGPPSGGGSIIAAPAAIYPPTQGVISTPYGPVTPSNFNQIQPPVVLPPSGGGGNASSPDIAYCMSKTPGWSATQCQVRLDQLVATIAAGKSNLANQQGSLQMYMNILAINQNYIPQEQAVIAAQTAAIAQINSEIAALPPGDPLIATLQNNIVLYQQSIAQRNASLIRAQSDIIDAQQNIVVYTTGVANAQSTLSAAQSEYLNLTGKSI